MHREGGARAASRGRLKLQAKLDIRDVIDRTQRLITLPEVYFLVRDALDNPAANHQDLAAAIGRDPALASRLLKIANSAWFGYAGRVSTLQRAAMLVGTQRLYDLVLAASVVAAFSGIEPGRLDIRSFWVNSAFSAAAGRLLARESHVLDVERIFVAGLLRDIGHLLLYQAVPGLTMAARDEAEASKLPLAVVERRLLGCDFTEVGGELLQAWQVPVSLHQAVRCQLQPGQAEVAPFDSALLNMAGVLTEAFARQVKPESLYTAVADLSWTLTGITPEQLTGVYYQACGEAELVTELLFAPLRMG